MSDRELSPELEESRGLEETGDETPTTNGPVIPDDQLVPWWEWQGERERRERARRQQVVPAVASNLERAKDLEPAERSLAGISHDELLALEVPATTQLVEDVIEAGTLGTIAALPERYKSWVANELAFKVGSGQGRLFGQAEILKSGPVGYWWQDDSLANEVNRARAYASRHGHSAELPIRWHLNEGLRLPDDIPALVEEIERERQVSAATRAKSPIRGSSCPPASGCGPVAIASRLWPSC